MKYQTNIEVVTTQSENTTIETTITTKTAVPEFGDEVIVRKKGEPSKKTMVFDYSQYPHVYISDGCPCHNAAIDFTNAKWNDEHARWEIEVTE